MTDHLSIVQLCESRGVGLTPKRRRIAEVIDRIDGAFDIEGVFHRLMEDVAPGFRPAASRSSVFGAVRFFVDVGVIAPLGMNGRRLSFARLSPIQISLKDSSGARLRLDDPDLQAKIVAMATHFGLKADGREIHLIVGGARDGDAQPAKSPPS